MGIRQSTPEVQRIDLRTFGWCYPYPVSADQGDEVSCVAQALSMTVYCSMARRGLSRLPHSKDILPNIKELYRKALARSGDPTRGTSFDAVVDELFDHYSKDLRFLGCKPIYLQNEVETLRSAIARGFPVVAGYQVNEAISRFHDDLRECEACGYVLPSYARDPISKSAHCVVIVGFDDAVECFIARNSWGSRWGVDGHFLIRYLDVENPIFFTDLLVLQCD